MGDPNLVTTCTFHGQEYLFKMSVLNSNLEILVTDKNSGEEWQCSYDATYVENLTQKTGNFKQFDIFVAMIKSGLLKTSESVSLDLLTFEDLEMLRSRKITKSVGPASNNRRYLILTYIVEFDKIRYPLPLEYCGPPDPVILQATIRRLEIELARTKEELAVRSNNNEAKRVFFLQKRVDELLEENAHLHEEVSELTKCLGKRPKTKVITLQKAVSDLEKSVAMERNSHHELVEKLRQDKIQLTKQLEKVKMSERSLKSQLNRALSQASRIGIGDHCKRLPEKQLSTQSVRTMYKRRPSLVTQDHHEIKAVSSRPNLLSSRSKDCFWNKNRSTRSLKHNRSRSSSASSANRYLDPEPEYGGGTSRQESPQITPRLSRSKNVAVKSRFSSGNSTGDSSRQSSKKGRKRLDYKKLEEKIENLQKMLKSNLVHDK